ncbi:hypothetical protein Cgig2_022814 [Carnegiea gigantea]|uniref:RRM domain-containing protein n=1 Tax=Carnegiea gigantea TaxID=171969 RepID=A0A9Q1KQ70_9CARY|nr:hypothetical protein Cgig2_022814 [Carnegiea gigantea]
MEDNGRPQKEFSVFVQNIPEKLDQYGLKGIFRKASIVRDAYIPARRSKCTGRHYGFVRFRSLEEAARSIMMHNNSTVGGSRIRVSIARFEKGRRRVQSKSPKGKHIKKRGPVRQEWRKKEITKGGDNHDNSQEEYLQVVKGQVNEELVERLHCSIVCTTDSPRDFGTLASALISGFGLFTKIWALSKVWIEVLGVPPHGWHKENFKNIAELWRKLICLERAIDKIESFESMRILIDTAIFKTITGAFVLRIGDSGYRITVKEVGLAIHLIQQAQPSSACPSKEVTDSNKGVIGFQDLNDTKDIAKDMTDSNSKVANTPEVDAIGLEQVATMEEVHESPNFESKLKAHESGGRPEDNLELSMHSSTKTKTANFSQNGYSEKMFKITKWLSSLGNSVAQAGSDIQAPPGFENILEPNCSETIHLQQASTKISQPTRCEPPTRLGSVTQGICVKRKERKGKNAVAKSNKVSLSRRSYISSNETSNNIHKLVRESFEIGKLLGVSVVENEKAVEARITKSLKKSKKVSTTRGEDKNPK